MELTARTITHVLPVANLNQKEVELLIEYLTKHGGYVPTLRKMFINVFGDLKLNPPNIDKLAEIFEPTNSPMTSPADLMGDIFFTKDSILVINPERTYLEASVIGFDNNSRIIKEFCDQITNGIKANFDAQKIGTIQFTWSPRTERRYQRYDRERMQVELETARDPNVTEPKYDEADIKGADLLSDRKMRESFVKLAKLGKMIMKDASTEFTADQLKILISLGLIAEEYLLTCKQDSHTICVVSSEKQLNSGPMAELRCTTCNRPFNDENRNTIVTIAEKGRNLVTSSKWMSIWITELFKNFGISKDAIKWNFVEGGDELDVLIQDFNTRVFIELKDREFGLGDAYPFSYRLNRYGGRTGVVATADKVSSDAKKFFEDESDRRDSPTFLYFEGVEKIPEGVKTLVQNMYKREIRRLVNPLRWKMGLDCWAIAEAWLDSKKQQIQVLTHK